MKNIVFKASVLVLLLAMVLAIGPGFALASKTVAGGKAKNLKVKTQNFDKQGRKLFVEDQIVVKYKNDNKPFRVINLPAGESIEEAVAKYKKNKEVEYVEPNYIAYADMTPSDPYYSFQWHMDIPADDENPDLHGTNGGGINIEPAWDVSTGLGVVVAVVDTGVAYENYEEYIDNPGRKADYWLPYAQAPDLAQTDFVDGYDFVNNDSHPNDDNGHGTHVTGTIAQSTNNGIGVAGIAYDSSIMPVKVLDSEGSGNHTWIADGIRYAVDHGANVINMSLGGDTGSDTLEAAVKYAYDNGVVVVCSAGNSGPDTINYPAAYDDYVIAVGATRYDETRSYYSSTGKYVDIVAPGGDVNVDQDGDGYTDGILQQTHNGSDFTTFGYYFYQGTSMASPHVAGVAALVIANGNANTVDDVRSALQETAEDKGDIGWDEWYGHGLVDAYAALQWTSKPNNPPSADNQSVITDEDTSVNIVLTASDLDDDILTYGVVISPSNGTLSGVAPNLSYIPNDNYNGNDFFAFKVNDGRTSSNIAEVSIVVNPVDDATIANGQSVTTSQDTAVSIILTVIDFDNDTLTYSVGDPIYGSLTGEAPNLTYTPNAGYIGEDNFTFKVNDGTTDSNVATVNISVEAIVEPTMTASVEVTTKLVKLNGWYEYATAEVTVFDADGKSVGNGVTVSGHWSGATSNDDSGVTNEFGQVVIESDTVRKTDEEFVFTVDELL